MSTYRTENPATGEVEETFPTLDDAALADAVTTAHTAFASWRSTPLEERVQVLRRTAELYRQKADELARIIAREMGKPLEQGVGEVKLSASIYAYYADNAERLLAQETPDARGGASNTVLAEPVGVLLGVMPWNFPYYQVARFAAPNLLLGNTVLLKHASICAASNAAMARIFEEAGLPEGVFTALFASSSQIPDVIADPRVQGVSLTGSEAAGASVAQAAGQHLKKSVLELGGSDAMIVLGGDVAATAAVAAQARLSNAGQACNSPKRMIVLDGLYDEFVEALVGAVGAATVGDPLEAGTQVGPLSSSDAVDDLLEQVQDAVDKGANLRVGGARLDRPGNFMAPTVLTDVVPGMRAYTEELFGPVAVVYRVSSIDEAVELANSSEFGLSGSVWTDDLEQGQDVAGRLDVGMAFVNEHGTTQAGLPFGGVKRSGYGRELGRFGVDEFVNKKLVRVASR